MSDDFDAIVRGMDWMPEIRENLARHADGCKGVHCDEHAVVLDLMLETLTRHEHAMDEIEASAADPDAEVRALARKTARSIAGTLPGLEALLHLYAARDASTDEQRRMTEIADRLVAFGRRAEAVAGD